MALQLLHPADGRSSKDGQRRGYTPDQSENEGPAGAATGETTQSSELRVAQHFANCPSPLLYPPFCP